MTTLKDSTNLDVLALAGRQQLVLYSMVFNPKTNIVWASEWGTNQLLRLDLLSTQATLLPAPGGDMNELCLDGQGLLYLYNGSGAQLYIVDEMTNVLRTISHDEGDATKIAGTEDGVILCTRRENNFYLRRFSSSGDELSGSHFPTYASQQNFSIKEFPGLYSTFYVCCGSNDVYISEETDSIVVHRVSREGTYLGVHNLAAVSRADVIGVTVSGKQVKAQPIHLLGMTAQSNTDLLTILCNLDGGASSRSMLLFYKDDGTTTQFKTPRIINRLVFSDSSKVLGYSFFANTCCLSTFTDVS